CTSSGACKPASCMASLKSSTASAIGAPDLYQKIPEAHKQAIKEWWREGQHQDCHEQRKQA
ncbi:MAG: hypothetical protein KDE63_11870, partial [Novosphingobium sp.]|nr:hypothetical protein [Novosphingobium sp.]